VTVKLVHEDGSDHASCSLDSSEERKNALCKKIGPFNRMTTEYVVQIHTRGLLNVHVYSLGLKICVFAERKERKGESWHQQLIRQLPRKVIATKWHAYCSLPHWKQNRVLLY
jgi:hypothetical protein